MGALSVIFFYTNDQLPKITKVKFREFCVFLRLKNSDCVPAYNLPTNHTRPSPYDRIEAVADGLDEGFGEGFIAQDGKHGRT